MERNAFRRALKLHYRVRFVHTMGRKVASAIPDSSQSFDKKFSRDSFQFGYQHRQSFLLNHTLCASRCATVQPFQTRSIIISKVIDAFREADVTSIAGLSKLILHSSPVSAVHGFYEWTEAVTGLPWGLNILLSSFLLQLFFNAPAAVYMGRWMTGKEKHIADMIAIKSSVLRAPSRESIALYHKLDKELIEEYGCQKYKLYLGFLYQLVYVTITSFGVRSVLISPETGLQDAQLPWGSLLSVPDPTFFLPIATVALSLTLVEIAAWKKLNSQDGLKMTMKRASVPFKTEPLYILNVRRACCLPFLAIYSIVPSALCLHWLAMLATSINVQILLSHAKTRRTLHLAPCYYETDKPYQDFFKYLREDYSLVRKRSLK